MSEAEDDIVAEKLSRALVQFRYLYHYSKQTYNGNKFEYCSLRPSDVMMLFAIKNQQRKNGGDVTATQLSANMGIKPPSINPVLSVLEKKGLILRTTDPSDRRFVRITLSGEGEKMIQQFQDRFETKMRGLVAYLGIEKSSQLADLMNEVYSYLQQKNQDKAKK